MAVNHALERIVVVPVNGYVNRLQAWASASILGAELDVPVQVLWEPEAIAAAPADVLFAPQRVRMSFVAADEVQALLGARHQDLPRYLRIDRDRRAVFLAGHDRGEQIFMDSLVEALQEPSAPTSLVIVAGGTFSLPGTQGLAEQRRRAFYRQIEWHPVISNRVASELQGRAPFIGLHVRGTDRSREAPTKRVMLHAISNVAATRGLQDVFIAADSHQARQDWLERVAALGLHPWSTGKIVFDRGESEAGVDAIVDWIVLGSAQAVVYSAASSFGREAAVAADDTGTSVGLHASATRQQVRAALTLGKSVVTFPSRRWRTPQGGS